LEARPLGVFWASAGAAATSGGAGRSPGVPDTGASVFAAAAFVLLLSASPVPCCSGALQAAELATRRTASAAALVLSMRAL
jgi:hypothetical protein